MVAAFGSGAMFSLVSGMGGPNQVANAVTSGLFFSLVQGGLFKVRINNNCSIILINFKHFKHVLGCSFVLIPKFGTCLRINGVFQLGEKYSKPPAEDVFYAKTRSMLSNLGLASYEKNFKKGLLTDSTLPLLTDRHVYWIHVFILMVIINAFAKYVYPSALTCASALRDVKIPPGPRLLILDHIQRF